MSALPDSTAQRLRTQVNCLPILIAGTATAAMDRRIATGKWSAKENLAHLARYQKVFIERVRQILAQEAPNIAAYSAEKDPEWPDWASLSTDEIMRRLRSQREQIITVFEALTAEQLERVGRHSRFGEMTLLQWLEFFLLHEAHHLLAVLQRLRESR